VSISAFSFNVSRNSALMALLKVCVRVEISSDGFFAVRLVEGPGRTTQRYASCSLQMSEICARPRWCTVFSLAGGKRDGDWPLGLFAFAPFSSSMLPPRAESTMSATGPSLAPYRGALTRGGLQVSRFSKAVTQSACWVAVGRSCFCVNFSGGCT